MSAGAAGKDGDLSVTALYTAGAWAWAGLPGAELLASPESRRVFDATNAALALARPFQRDPRSLKHGLVHRHAMIDHLLQASGARQVIELAAGLSRRGVSVSADPAVRYTEVDLPHVVAKKRALLERSPEGRAALARPNLSLLARDVTRDSLLERVEPGAPLFVIAEGLFVYLTPAEQRALFGAAHALVERAGGGSFAFDLLPSCEEPAPGAAGRALGFLMERFTGGKSFERDGRTRGDITQELHDAGFTEARAIEPGEVAQAWGLPFAEVPTRQLVFVATAGLA